MELKFQSRLITEIPLITQYFGGRLVRAQADHFFDSRKFSTTAGTAHFKMVWKMACEALWQILKKGRTISCKPSSEEFVD
jgi:hypothetical protein